MEAARREEGCQRREAHMKEETAQHEEKERQARIGRELIYSLGRRRFAWTQVVVDSSRLQMFDTF